MSAKITFSTYGKTIAVFWVIFAIALFELAPRRFDSGFNTACGIIYAVMCVSYFKIKKKKNYFDFDTLFIITYFCVMLYFAVFMYSTDPERFIVFRYKYNTNLISKGSALAILGMASYMAGSIWQGNKVKQNSVKPMTLPHTELFALSAASFLAYIAMGGWHNLYVGYMGGRTVDAEGSNYMAVFAYITLFCLMIVWFNNAYLKNSHHFYLNKIPLPELLYAAFIIIIYLIASSRATPMRIVLIFFGLYTVLYRNFSLKKMLILVVVGMAAMFAMQQYRAGYLYDSNNIVFADVISDLIFNARHTYVALDYVDHHGLNWGRSMISYLASPIPFLNGFILRVTGIHVYESTSAGFFSVETLGTNSNWGLGTNIISDIYISFGTVGVAVMMFMLGFLISKLHANAKRNIYYLTAYIIMLAYSVVLVRCEYFFPLRSLLWALAIIYILRLCRKTYGNRR